MHASEVARCRCCSALHTTDAHLQAKIAVLHIKMTHSFHLMPPGCLHSTFANASPVSLKLRSIRVPSLLLGSVQSTMHAFLAMQCE